MKESKAHNQRLLIQEFLCLAIIYSKHDACHKAEDGHHKAREAAERLQRKWDTASQDISLLNRCMLLFIFCTFVTTSISMNKSFT